VPRVLRGGAYLDNAGYVRCAARHGSDPLNRGGLVGFRVVASPVS
jgi:formylglycine-generating enzyme required for sulfatase activity